MESLIRIWQRRHLCAKRNIQICRKDFHRDSMVSCGCIGVISDNAWNICVVEVQKNSRSKKVIMCQHGAGKYRSLL